MKTKIFCYITMGDVGRSSREMMRALPEPDRMKDRPTAYKFYYEGLLDYDDFESFYEDLSPVFVKDGQLKLKPLFEYGSTKRENHDCTKVCELDGEEVIGCKYSESFDMAWLIRWNLRQIKSCYCGGYVYPERKGSKAPIIIHDARLRGHPTQIQIQRNWQWICRECGRSISSMRIPGLQYAAGASMTMRLMHSMFNLHVSGVDAGFIADGYDLKRDNVTKLCRQFAARTEAEFEAKREQMLGWIKDDSVSQELVIIDGKRYLAIFSDAGRVFHGFLEEEDVLNVLRCLDGCLPEKAVKKEQRRTAAHMAFVAVSPVHRMVAADMFDLIQEAQVETVDKRAEAHENLAGWVNDLMCRVLIDDTLEFKELQNLLSDKENFRAVFTRGEQEGESTYLYRTLRKAKEIVGKFEQQEWRWYEEVGRESGLVRWRKLRQWEESLKKRTALWERSGFIKDIEYLCELSCCSVHEKLQRLQFLNEPATCSTRLVAFDGDENAWADEQNRWLPDSKIGEGIPVACLEHLLREGLLDRGIGQIHCIQHRKRGGESPCSLECPFLK